MPAKKKCTCVKKHLPKCPGFLKTKVLINPKKKRRKKKAKKQASQFAFLI